MRFANTSKPLLAEENFGKKRDQIRGYMALAAATPRKPFKSLNEMHRKANRRKDRAPVGCGSAGSQFECREFS